MSRIIFVVSLCFSVLLSSAQGAQPAKVNNDGKVRALLDKARREIFREQHVVALKLLESYLKFADFGKVRPILHFYVIDAIGRIHLRTKQDPDGAIKFFTKVENDPRLTAAEQDIVSGWIAGAKEWKSLGKMPSEIQDGNQLFEIGKRYYETGIKVQRSTLDPAGSAAFSIAANYLVPFTVHYDKDVNAAEALYMMGEIRRRTWHDNEYWSENFYLLEVIRRFPHTPLAVKAYTALEEDVHFGYSGSAGDDTPASWLALLKDFKIMASAKKESNQQPPVKLK